MRTEVFALLSSAKNELHLCFLRLKELDTLFTLWFEQLIEKDRIEAQYVASKIADLRKHAKGVYLLYKMYQWIENQYSHGKIDEHQLRRFIEDTLRDTLNVCPNATYWVGLTLLELRNILPTANPVNVQDILEEAEEEFRRLFKPLQSRMP